MLYHFGDGHSALTLRTGQHGGDDELNIAKFSAHLFSGVSTDKVAKPVTGWSFFRDTYLLTSFGAANRYRAFQADDIGKPV